MQKVFFLTLFFLTVSLSVLHGQNAVLSAGGDATGPGGTVAYSIGQVAYTNYTAEDGNVSLGIQQPYLIITVSNSEPEANIFVSVSPNPTSTSVNLKFDDQFSNYDDEDFNFGLYDMHGKLLLQQKIISSVTPIPLENIPNAVYYIRVMSKHAEIKTFKIFKTN